MNRKAISSGFLRASLAMTAVLLLLFLSAPVLRAQVDAGTILGTVADTSGAPINGAKVTLTNEGTSATLSTTTGPDGSYKFTPVKIGSYKLTASFQGFQTITQTNVPVNVGADVVVNFALKPGSVTEVIEVSSAPPVLETQSGSVGQVVDSRSVNDLPLNGRNFTFLAQLAAGVNRSEEHTSELQSRLHLVCRLLLEKKNGAQAKEFLCRFYSIDPGQPDEEHEHPMLTCRVHALEFGPFIGTLLSFTGQALQGPHCECWS